ncbi:hypothetical protein [Citrobacter sp. VF227]
MIMLRSNKKNEHVYLIVTQDGMFFQGISTLAGAKFCVHIRQEQDICLHRHRKAVVIIDTLMNNIFHNPMAECLKRLEPTRIIILSPFGVSRLFPGEMVIFISRDVHAALLSQVLFNGDDVRSPKIYFTKTQHRIITSFLRLNNARRIAAEMDIAQKTLNCHQYHIMLLLNLRKFSLLLTHSFAPYFRHIDSIQGVK